MQMGGGNKGMIDCCTHITNKRISCTGQMSPEREVEEHFAQQALRGFGAKDAREHGARRVLLRPVAHVLELGGAHCGQLGGVAQRRGGRDELPGGVGE